MATLRDAALRAVHRLGWRTAARVPQRALRPLLRLAARAAVRHDGGHVRTLRRNLSLATGAPAGHPLLVAAVTSYLRTFVEVLALPGWSADDVVARVSTSGEEVLRRAYAERGAVVALPHSANWDLAGAWACRTGMPVTTVAEQLPDAEYRAFVAFRERLGMQVLPHGDPGTLTALVRAARDRRLVCLVADRDLSGAGVAVDWRGQAVTMPGGPALVARLSGAALVPAVCSYAGDRMLIAFGPVVAPRPGRDGLRQMTQEVADFFAARIAGRPEDWHLMQPFFGPS